MSHENNVKKVQNFLYVFIKKMIDYEMSEKNLLPTLSEYFNCPLEKTSTYFTFDYKSSSKDRPIYIELKCRSNTKDAYSTTMIGYNKMIAGLRLINTQSYEIYFVFQFTDGLYYYKLHKNSEQECNISFGGRNDRGGNEYKKYCFIPVCLLTEISRNHD